MQLDHNHRLLIRLGVQITQPVLYLFQSLLALRTINNYSIYEI